MSKHVPAWQEGSVVAPPGEQGASIEESSLATCTLNVDGMDCSGCAATVERSLRGLQGVREVHVDVMGGKVTVGYEGFLPRAQLTAAINSAGYQVRGEESVTRRAFDVEGMDCADEIRLIENRLGTLPGVRSLSFDLVNRRLTVEGEVAASAVEAAVREVGLRARLLGQSEPARTVWERRGRLFLAGISGIFWISSILSEHLLEQRNAAALLAVAAIVSGGWYIVPKGVRAARNRALDMNFLMSVAAVGAVLIGEFEEGASAMFLFAVAQLLESYSMDRARKAIRALMSMAPAEATVLRDAGETRLPVEQVRVGETVLVRPGEKIPVDGLVLAGRSAVNQAPITGESMPVDKERGASVFAGSLNGEGVLEVQSSKPASDTTIARIIEAVEVAQASRAPSQTFVDRFARVYTPAVVLLALTVLLVPPLAGWGTWDEWIYRALALLVVACPCALVISTPVTIVSALAGAARQGILIKGGLHLENAGRVSVVALDKTGTLTEGRPEVVEVITVGNWGERHLIELALAVEARSEHPLAQAVVRYADKMGIAAESGLDVQSLTGRGVSAVVGGEIVYLGNERLFMELGAYTPNVKQVLEAQAGQGRTAVILGVSASEGVPPRPIGVLAIADRVRPGARGALTELHAAGIKRVVMLTGDNEGTARSVAEQLGGPGIGVDEHRSEMLPQGKTAAVKELQARYGRVLFVGDGVNDAPALAAADVGVAMGAGGSDAALEIADIALMGDDLSSVAATIRLARKGEGIIRTNIAFALVTKGLFVVLAVLGYATLWMAVFADMGASLIVVLNGLRALRD